MNQSRFSRVLSSLRKLLGLKVLLGLIILFILPSCVSRQAKGIVREKHATSYILRQRLIDDDPNNDPTADQLKRFMISTSKDWESMDMMLNNWKPNENVKKIDLEK